MSELDNLVTVPPDEMLGEAMLALNPRQRRFVCALAAFGGQQAEAYRAAGYDVKTDGSASAGASRLARQPDIIAAMNEEAHRRLRGSPLLAVSTLVELMSPRNPDQKMRLKAANSALDRVKGFASKSEHQIIITDERTTEQLIEIIRANASLIGANATALLGHVVDAEFEEVTEGSTAGIEDLF